MFSQLGVEAQDRCCDPRRRRVPRQLCVVIVANHTMGQLEACAIVEDIEFGFDAEAHAVLLQQVVGESVVSRNVRLAIVVRCDRQPAHALCEFGGGLVGERQPQNSVGGHQTLMQQPGNPSRHDGRLTGTGSGSHQGRLQWCGDRSQLFATQRMAEQTGEDLAGGAHSDTSVPASTAGQATRTSHLPHLVSSGRAGNCSARIPLATWASAAVMPGREEMAGSSSSEVSA